MSARAAWRLESLGFGAVYDYAPGKRDWSASGLPMEGELAGIPSIGDVMRKVVMTCRPDASLGQVRKQMAERGEDVCVVVNDGGVVLGRLDRPGLAGVQGGTVEEAMRAGPSTYRPDVPLQEILARMREHDLANILVTDPDGRLLGLLTRQRTEEAAWTTDGHRALAAVGAGAAADSADL